MIDWLVIQCFNLWLFLAMVKLTSDGFLQLKSFPSLLLYITDREGEPMLFSCRNGINNIIEVGRKL